MRSLSCGVVAIALLGCAASSRAPRQGPSFAGARGPGASCEPDEAAASIGVAGWAEGPALLSRLGAGELAVVRRVGSTLHVLEGCSQRARYARVEHAYGRSATIQDGRQLCEQAPFSFQRWAELLALPAVLELKEEITERWVLVQVVAPELLGDCEGATHVVRGAEVGGFSVSATDARQRYCGPGEACQPAAPRELERGAGAPVRLELAPLRSAPGAPPSVAAPRVDVEGPGGERWTMRAASGEEVCPLPCAAWLFPSPALQLRREEPQPPVKVSLRELPAGDDQAHLRVGYRPDPAWLPLSIGGLVLGGAMAAGGVALLATPAPSPAPSEPGATSQLGAHVGAVLASTAFKVALIPLGVAIAGAGGWSLARGAESVPSVDRADGPTGTASLPSGPPGSAPPQAGD